MLHRFTLRLYDDVDLEAEVLDYLHSQPASRRSELIRDLIKRGFNELREGGQRRPRKLKPTAMSDALPPAVPCASTGQKGDTVPGKGNSPATPDINPAGPVLDEHRQPAPPSPAPLGGQAAIPGQGHDDDDDDDLDPLARLKKLAT